VKITKSKLKQIIKEEISKLIKEQGTNGGDDWAENKKQASELYDKYWKKALAKINEYADEDDYEDYDPTSDDDETQFRVRSAKSLLAILLRANSASGDILIIGDIFKAIEEGWAEGDSEYGYASQEIYDS